MKIIKGDKVIIISGKDKGRQGEIIQVFPKKGKIVIKGLNLFKKHIKAQANNKGGVLEKERPLNASKVMVICPNCQKKTRVAYQLDKAGKKYRICRLCQSMLNKPVKK